MLCCCRLLFLRLGLAGPTCQALCLFLPSYLCTLLALELLVSLFKEGDMLVEFCHIEGSGDVEIPVADDGIAERQTIVEFRSPHPVVGGRISRIGLHPVEYRNQVERQLIGSRER